MALALYVIAFDKWCWLCMSLLLTNGAGFVCLLLTNSAGFVCLLLTKVLVCMSAFDRWCWLCMALLLLAMSE